MKEDTLVRLQTHLLRTAQGLSDDFDEASEKHSGTPEAVAHARELSLRTVVGRFFPFPYRVTKGPIFDSYGNRSASIDCVVCSPSHPYLRDESGNIEIILVDGVHAAIELKPDLRDLPEDFGKDRKQEVAIIRGLRQVSTVKNLLRTEGGLIPLGKPSQEKLDYSMRCPSYILAQKTSDIRRLARYVADFYVANEVQPSEQVDVILVLNNGIILNNKCSDFSLTRPIDGKGWRPHVAAYEKDVAFLLFVLRLSSEIAPEAHMSTPVLKRYLDKLTIPRHVASYATVRQI